MPVAPVPSDGANQLGKASIWIGTPADSPARPVIPDRNPRRTPPESGPKTLFDTKPSPQGGIAGCVCGSVGGKDHAEG
jgi:hypothetical protein